MHSFHFKPSASAVSRALALASTPVLLVAGARSQCLDWRTFPYTGGTLSYAHVNGLHVFDDGTGPAVYVAQRAPFMPDQSFNIVKRWDGTTFSTVGGGLNGTSAEAWATFDDGTGPALYVSGGVSLPSGGGGGGLAKWNGAAWQIVPGSAIGAAHAMCVFDDGTGPALFVTGDGSNLLWKWDGTTWTGLGGSVGSATVWSITSHDDGSGAALYVGGIFHGSGGGADNIARWRAGTWSGFPAGSIQSVGAGILGLASFDDGSGPALYACGSFPSPTQSIQRWNGSTWNPVGTGDTSGFFSLGVLDLGSGPRLCAGVASSSPGVRVWDGTSWTSLSPSNPASCITSQGLGIVRALAVIDYGNGPSLIAGGDAETLGSVGSDLWRWSQGDWEAIDRPAVHGLAGTSLYDFEVFDFGQGPQLVAAGAFCGADDHSIPGIARWNGTTWQALGAGAIYGARALGTFDPGSGPELFATTQQATLTRWNGQAWASVGGSVSVGSAMLAVQQFGADLYVGGSFTAVYGNPSGNVASPNLVKWNGTAFSPVGNGSLAGVQGQVNALTTFDDGHGVALYAAGTFTSGNGVALNRIGRWDGQSWTPLGSGASGFSDVIDALAVFDDGTGPALYAGGTFASIGGVAAARVARWNGTSWSALGAGLDQQVLSLGVFDDGSGPALYAGGNFAHSGTTQVNRIARWSGSSWTQLGAGVDGPVWALRGHDDGSGPELFLGGAFQTAGALPSNLFAAWRGCDGAISRYCFGDGSVAACPCANQGLSGRGCDNSVASGGARLNASGTASPDTIVLYAAGELPNAATLVFQGDVALTAPATFGDGLRCVGGSIKRMYTTTAVNGTISVPAVGQASVSARSAALGDSLVAGSVRSYQAWYRDPSPGFCPPSNGSTWNLSNAVRIVW